MSRLQDKAYKEGEEDYERTKDDFFGAKISRPWPDLLSTPSEDRAKAEARQKGFDDAKARDK